MTKIKTNICRKHVELSVIAISNVLVEKGHLCNNFPNPLPQNLIIFHSIWHMILLMILPISEIYQSFLFSVQFNVVNTMQTSFYAKTLFILPSHGPTLENMCQTFLTKDASVLFVLIGEKVI